MNTELLYKNVIDMIDTTIRLKNRGRSFIFDHDTLNDMKSDTIEYMYDCFSRMNVENLSHAYILKMVKNKIHDLYLAEDMKTKPDKYKEINTISKEIAVRLGYPIKKSERTKYQNWAIDTMRRLMKNNSSGFNSNLNEFHKLSLRWTRKNNKFMARDIEDYYEHCEDYFHTKGEKNESKTILY